MFQAYPQLAYSSEIAAVQTEAGAHGDNDLAELCARALNGDGDARVAVSRIIHEAKIERLHEAATAYLEDQS